MNAQFSKSLPRPAVPPNAERSAVIIASIRERSAEAREAYEARKDRRVERLENAAANARASSQAHYETSNKMAAVIPFGQPILVGHYSEKRDRNYREKIAGHMDKFCEEHDRAIDLEHRAKAAADNDAIMSDDPDALAKLREKLAGLEAMQQMRKAVNAAHVRFLKNPASLEAAELPEKYKALIRTYQPAYSWEPHPFPPYSMQNANGNIKRVRDRIEYLSKMRTTENVPDRHVWDGTVRIVDNVDENRLQIFFPNKPTETMRKTLKQNGFRWAPSVGAWQSYRGNRAEIRLQWIFPELKS